MAIGLAVCLAPSPGIAAQAKLDPTFGGDGSVFTEATAGSPGPGGSRVVRDSSGRLVAVTGAGDGLLVARYTANGQLDGRFGTGGAVRVSLSGGASRRENDEATAGAVAVQPDGRILVGGSYDPNVIVLGGSGRAMLALARLLPDGGVDRSFGGDSSREMPPGGVIERRGTNVLAIALQGDRVLLGGEAESGPAYVARYTADGKLDRSFGRGTGMAKFARRLARGAITGLLATPGGKVYAAGYLGPNFLLARLHGNGVSDRGFGRRGRVLTDAAGRRGCGCSLGEGLARDRRGRLLVSGTILARRPPGFFNPDRVSGARAIALARYRSGGALDRAFGRGGIVRTRVGAEAHGRAVALQRNGRIVVAGSSAAAAGGSDRFTVVRYLPGGGRDKGFFGDGVFARSLGALSSGGWEPLVDGAGRLVVAGGGAFGKSLEASRRGILLARFLAD